MSQLEVDGELAQGRYRNWFPLIIGAVAVIAIGHLFSLLHLTPPGLAENRVLAGVPAVPKSLPDWAALPKRLDDFVSDNFPPRAYMISGLNYLRYRLGYSGSPQIIVGRGGWLFYDDSSHLALGTGKIRLDHASVDAWVKGFQQRVDYLGRRGIKFYMTVGPVKEDIYPERRPHWLPDSQTQSEMDDIFKAAHQAGFTQLVDPRGAIRAERNEQVLYDGYDTHWTALGAYLGYRALMSRIAQDFPDLAPLPLLARFEAAVGQANTARDLALMLGIANFVTHDRKTFITTPIHDPARTDFLSARQDWTAPQVLHTDSPSGKTVVLLRDSFTSEMLPLLKEHFTTIVMAHLQDGTFRTDLIEKYHPDAVILIVIETGMRHMMSLMSELEMR